MSSPAMRDYSNHWGFPGGSLGQLKVAHFSISIIRGLRSRKVKLELNLGSRCFSYGERYANMDDAVNEAEAIMDQLLGGSGNSI